MRKNKQGFKGALRAGEKEYARRNPVQDAKGLVHAYKSNIEFSKTRGWDTSEDEAKLKVARKKLKEVLASGVKDIDYDEKGNLKNKIDWDTLR